MHYKNGREAKVGDTIIANYNGLPIAAIVGKANAQANTCNLQAFPIHHNEFFWATAKECLHTDDALNIKE